MPNIAFCTGVIGELAREREAREQNLTSVTDPEDLARRTRTIIEGRDIDQLIHSQAKTQTDDGNLQLKQQKKGQTSFYTPVLGMLGLVKWVPYRVCGYLSSRLTRPTRFNTDAKVLLKFRDC